MPDLNEDRELAAVLIALSPLGERGLRYVNIERREFSYLKAIEYPWSTGERLMFDLAQSLWAKGTVDVGDIVACLSGDFFLAAMNAIAARRGADFSTSIAGALPV